MEFIIPKGFLEGRVAVRCGKLVREFWDFVVRNPLVWRSEPLTDGNVLEMTRRYGGHLAIAFVRVRGALGWCSDEWYRSAEGLDIIDIEECINEQAVSIEPQILSDILFI